MRSCIIILDYVQLHMVVLYEIINLRLCSDVLYKGAKGIKEKEGILYESEIDN